MDKVQILLENNTHYALVTSLVDREEFILAVEKVRKEFSISKPLAKSLKAFQDHFIVVAGLEPLQYKRKVQSEPNIKGFETLFEAPERLRQYLIEIHDELDSDTEAFHKVMQLEQKFFNEIKKIRIDNGFLPLFDTVILQSILYNEVNLFKTAYATVINDPPYSYESEEDLDIKRNAVMAIVVSPYSTNEDIKIAFENGKKDFLNQISESRYFEYRDLPQDTITNIKRNRKWYWMNKQEKMGYGKIAKVENQNEQTVKSAIYSYKKLISK